MTCTVPLIVWALIYSTPASAEFKRQASENVGRAVEALSAWINSPHPDLDRYLLIISTIFIILSLVMYWLREFACPAIRRYRLKWPFKSYFLITSKDRFDLGYAAQDDNEHEIKVLVLPSHTYDLFLHVILKAKLDFTQHHLEFSFEGARQRKPLINYWFHPFVKSGPSVRRPGEYPGHYIDYHDNYHIEGVQHRAEGQTITAGFKISTRDPGIYYLKIGVVADGVDGVADGTDGRHGEIGLLVRVEDHPTTNMRCGTHSHLIPPRPVVKF
jgi:hypothetical protein